MEKACRSCGLTKEISEYYKHSQMKDGHLNKCKDCQKQSTLNARLARPEYYKEYDKKRSMLDHRVQARKEYRKTKNGKLVVAKAHKKQRDLHPNKAIARFAVSNALRDGKLFKTCCHICGCEKVEAHHADYDRFLEVVWLCNKHHREAHNLLRKP